MKPSPLRSSTGFTYIAALVLVIITGIMLSVGTRLWATRMKREREKELIFRGEQYRTAIGNWYNWGQPQPGQARRSILVFPMRQAQPDSRH